MDQSTDYLDMVPVEVWAACWVLCTARQLRRISLVCHLFRSISLPLLLQHQTFDLELLVSGIDRDNWMDRVCHLHRTAVRLDRLSAGPLIPLVRSWAVTFGPTPSTMHYPPQIRHIGLFDAIQSRVRRTFCTTLNLYRNLETLYIVGLTFDPAMWNTLLALPKLEDLHLHHSLVARDAGSGATADGTQQVLMLRSLGLGHSSLLLDGFAGRRLDNLAHLFIGSVDDVEPFFRFLERCPRLESLAIMSLESSALKPFPPTCLPHLRSLNGPAGLIRLLAPDRPVSWAVIVDEFMVADERLKMDELMLTCSDLSRSSVSIHSLALPRTSPTLEFLNRIVRMFPHVRELSLGIESFHMPSYIVHPLFVPPEVEVEGDMELPEFCDAEAFDNLPKEELSDDESDDHPPIVVVPKESSFSTDNPVEVVLEWITGGSIALSSDLEILRLDAMGLPCELELPKQHQALALLGARWPSLYEVQFGLWASTWRRMGTLWKSDGKSPVRILPDTHGVLSGTQEMASSQLA
ncbi:hypothetical protein DFH08DRAFT_883864 [Mycena albidolilacea]|uniref:F-box domain-containing protein n=1 Tax=Mycena albidolilacea TaxID=1033008 RepID=A0AAD6ZMF9_9AGAR|nr:hypothetical protein DFH08DRAFT_883864 [Mycena albidolilacea]